MYTNTKLTDEFSGEWAASFANYIIYNIRIQNQNSLSGKTFYRQISRSLEAAKLYVIMIV